jgi:hypothetical protein
MSRCIVSIGTDRYARGLERLRKAFFHEWTWTCAWFQEGWPTHEERPYAFKAYALKEQADEGDEDTLLWCDACIVPGARPLADLWEYIEENGVWLARNGWTNYEWTADDSYPALFPEFWTNQQMSTEHVWENMRAANREIEHVVATAFGVSLKHPKGRAFLDEYYRLASETKAFCGPWQNMTGSPPSMFTDRAYPCGPPDVRGHRHDQTAASVIAWRLGVPLTNCPEWFSYRGGETDKTCLVADGAY